MGKMQEISYFRCAIFVWFEVIKLNCFWNFMTMIGSVTGSGVVTSALWKYYGKWAAYSGAQRGIFVIDKISVLLFLILEQIVSVIGTNLDRNQTLTAVSQANCFRFAKCRNSVIKLCHFHYSNFPRLSDDLHRELRSQSNRDESDKNALSKTAESLLPNKYMSCVRQLLQEGKQLKFREDKNQKFQLRKVEK